MNMAGGVHHPRMPPPYKSLHYRLLRAWSSHYTGRGHPHSVWAATAGGWFCVLVWLETVEEARCGGAYELSGVCCRWACFVGAVAAGFDRGQGSGLQLI